VLHFWEKNSVLPQSLPKLRSDRTNLKITDGTVDESADQNKLLIKDTWMQYSEKLFTDKAVKIIRVSQFLSLKLYVTFLHGPGPVKGSASIILSFRSR
jgi:hypothetical protein